MRLVVAATIFGVLVVGPFGASAEDEIPQAARLVKEAGNQFLAAKRYADAIDCYLQALEAFPDFAQAHYNLGVSFLKGFSANRIALYHFRQYLDLVPEASDRAEVGRLVEALASKTPPPLDTQGQVLEVVAGRLVVSGGNWVKKGDRMEISGERQDPRLFLLAEFVYPDCVLTQRIWDANTLGSVHASLVAVTATNETP